MNRRSRLTCAIAVLAMLMMQSNPALATFKGTLRSDTPWTVEITPNISNINSTAVTITFIDSRGRPDIDVSTIPPGDPFLAHSGPIPKGTRRIIVEVDNPDGGSNRVQIMQGATPIVVETAEGDKRFVFDVV